jgi:hypothetical protein
MSEVIETTAREDPEPAEVPRDDPPGQALTTVDRGNAAVAAAADAVLSMPGVAGRDEFLSLAMQARMLSLSGAAPEIIRNNPYVAFHVAMVGRDLGLSPTAAIELIDVIPAQGGPQLSLSPQLMNAQVHRVYGGEIVKAWSTNDRCVAVAVGPGGRDPRCRRTWPTYGDGPLHQRDCSCDIIGEAVFTWEDARMAGLVGPNCQPGAHVKDQNRSKNGRTWKVCGCNQGYITYPARMMWQRACGFAADDYFPGAGLGLYMPEALGAVVDEDGRPIDPATVALPEGYEAPAVGSGDKASADDPADPDDLWALQTRLMALPEPQRDAWREKKGQQDRLRGVPTSQLPAAALRLAKSIVSGLERDARKADPEWHPETMGGAVEVAVGASVVGWIMSGGCGWGGEDPEPAPASEPDVPASPPESRSPGPDGGSEPTDTPEPATGVTGAEVAAAHAAYTEVVKGMSGGDVTAELLERHADPGGTITARRQRLVALMVADDFPTPTGDPQ